MANVGGGQSNRSPKAAALLAMLLTVDGAGSGLDADLLDGADWAAPAAIGSGTPAAGSFTTLSATGAVSLTAASSGLTISKTTGTTLTIASTSAASATTAGGYTSTVATGTAPFTATSTTVCPNLNVSQLLGSTWASPAAIGTGTPAAGTFTALTNSALTSGRVTFASTAGLLTDAAAFTFSGGTLTVGANTVTSGFLSMNGPASAQRAFRFRSANVTLWEFGTTGTESGSDAGANLSLDARNDAGTFIDSPIAFTRIAGGAITLARPVSISTASSGLTIAITTGTSLVVSSTATTCATFGGGVTVGKTLTAAAGLTCHVLGGTPDASEGHMALRDSTAMAANVGGRIVLSGQYTSGGAIAAFGEIAGRKVDGVSGNFNGMLVLRAQQGASPFMTDMLTIRGDTFQATFVPSVIFRAATTSLTSIRIPHGAAPSSPTDGDMWTTTAGLYVRINGVTVGPLT